MEKRAVSIKDNLHFNFLNNNVLLKSKRSQITIFIILAIMIVVVLLLIFVGTNRVKQVFAPSSPVEQFEKCIQDRTKEGMNIISLQGGSINPENYYLYNDSKVGYLCYTNEYYKKCVNQVPLLKQHIENEINSYVSPKMNDCLSELKTSLEKDGNKVSYDSPKLSVKIEQGNVMSEVLLNLVIEKEAIQTYKTIKTSVGSDLYNNIMIASSINSFEASYGDSEVLNYMLFYPKLKLEKKKQGDGTKIYIITNKDSNERFIFAERSAVLPSGVTGK